MESSPYVHKLSSLQCLNNTQRADINNGYTRILWVHVNACLCK